MLRADLKQTLCDWLLALTAACLYYVIVAVHDTPVPKYHAMLGEYLTLGVPLVMVAYLLGPWRKPVPAVRTWWAWALCSVVLLVSMPGAGTPALVRDLAWGQMRLYMGVFLLGVLAWLAFRHGSQRLVVLVLGMFGVVHAALLLLVLMAVPATMPEDPLAQGWVPFHSHIRHVSFHGMIAACSGLILVFLGGRTRLLGMAIAAFALFGLAYFGARSAFLGWAVFVVLAIVLMPCRLRIASLSLEVLVAALVATAVASKAWKPAPFRGHLMDRASLISTAIDVTGRGNIWADAIKAVGERPLFGYGPEGYRTSRCCWAGTPQPHNVILHTLIEFGTFGLAALGLLAWATLWPSAVRAWRERGQVGGDQASALLLAMLAGLFAYAQFDGLSFHAVPLALIAMLLALLAATSSRDSSEGVDRTQHVQDRPRDDADVQPQ